MSTAQKYSILQNKRMHHGGRDWEVRLVGQDVGFAPHDFPALDFISRNISEPAALNLYT